jgi:hypothetical protein
MSVGVGVVMAATAIGFMGVLASVQSADQKAEKKPAARPKKLSNAELVNKLQERITIVRDFDANTPLKDVLEYLADHFYITIVIDSQALEDEAMDELETRPVGLRKPSDYRMADALRMVLSQARATYLIRNGVVEVTSRLAAAPDQLLRQTVLATFDKTPLSKALQELAESSGVSVMVDPRAQTSTPVTATLKNDVSLETAVCLLADMAGLKAVRVGGALYVTTKENAAALQAEEENMRRADKRVADTTKQPEETEKAK